MAPLHFPVSGVGGLGIGAASKISDTTIKSQPTQKLGQTSFDAVLSQLSTEAVSNLKAGEAAAMAGLQGKASTREVVDAVMKAEQSLQTVVAVRDKVIAAYLEVSRMQI